MSEGVSITIATIQIPLKDEVAAAYNASSEQSLIGLRRLLGFLIQEFVESTPESLLSVMDELSQEAEANGLTDDLLVSLLNDE